MEFESTTAGSEGDEEAGGDDATVAGSTTALVIYLTWQKSPFAPV